MIDWWSRIRALEPARVRAVWVAVVALLLSLGVVIPADVNDAVKALIVAVFTILPLAQGESTRAQVTPVAKLRDDAEHLAAQEADREWLANRDGSGADFIDLGGE